VEVDFGAAGFSVTDAGSRGVGVLAIEAAGFAALRRHFRREAHNELAGGRLVKNRDEVHSRECRQNFSAFSSRCDGLRRKTSGNHRSRSADQLIALFRRHPHAFVALQHYYQYVA